VTAFVTRTLLLAVVACPLAMSGCAVGPVGGPGYDIGADYYQPYSGYYGGWGQDYRVGPFRDDRPYSGHGAAHAWRGPVGGRAIPSIAGGRRGGGVRVGGFRGGGRGSRGGGGGHGR